MVNQIKDPAAFKEHCMAKTRDMREAMNNLRKAEELSKTSENENINQSMQDKQNFS